MAATNNKEPFVQVYDELFKLTYEKEINYQHVLLLSKIISLAQTQSACTASNDYFAGLFCTDIRSIQRWLSVLTQKALVKTFEQREGMRTTMRMIYPQHENIKKMIKAHDKIDMCSQEKDIPHDNFCQSTRQLLHEHMTTFVKPHDNIVTLIKEEKREEEKKTEGADAASEVPSDTLSSSASIEASSTPSFSLDSFSEQAKPNKEKTMKRRGTIRTYDQMSEEDIVCEAEALFSKPEKIISFCAKYGHDVAYRYADLLEKEPEPEKSEIEMAWESLGKGHEIDCCELEEMFFLYEENGALDKFESDVRDNCDLKFVDLDNFLKERGVSLISDAADDESDYWEI